MKKSLEKRKSGQEFPLETTSLFWYQKERMFPFFLLVPRSCDVEEDEIMQ
jgi:hypothetical protein